MWPRFFMSVLVDYTGQGAIIAGSDFVNMMNLTAVQG